jgi:hypothetical protein
VCLAVLVQNPSGGRSNTLLPCRHQSSGYRATNFSNHFLPFNKPLPPEKIEAEALGQHLAESD